MGQYQRERITEYLDIDLNTEKWCCRKCDQEIGDARKPYKHGLLVAKRDPREVHRPLIDPERYDYTFAPDPTWCQILEYYCPGCGTLVETEYLMPGHPITNDIELDVDWFKRRADKRAKEAANAAQEG
ncbi:MAG: acetone carboxylase subunit gamma [Pseudomonadota bacterium]